MKLTTCLSILSISIFSAHAEPTTTKTASQGNGTGYPDGGPRPATVTGFAPAPSCGPIRSCGQCPKGYDEQRYLDGKGYLCDSNSCKCQQASFSKDLCENCSGGSYIIMIDKSYFQGFCGALDQQTILDPLCQSGVPGKACKDFCIAGDSTVPSYKASDDYYALDGQEFCEDSGKGARRWTDRRCNVHVDGKPPDKPPKLVRKRLDLAGAEV